MFQDLPPWYTDWEIMIALGAAVIIWAVIIWAVMIAYALSFVL